jgi:hypothetical protein
VTGYGLNGRCSSPGRAKRFFFILSHFSISRCRWDVHIRDKLAACDTFANRTP